MFYLFGEKESLRTLMLVSANGAALATSMSAVKIQYRDLIKEISGEEKGPSSNNLVCNDEDQIRRLI